MDSADKRGGGVVCVSGSHRLFDRWMRDHALLQCPGLQYTAVPDIDPLRAGMVRVIAPDPPSPYGATSSFTATIRTSLWSSEWRSM